MRFAVALIDQETNFKIDPILYNFIVLHHHFLLINPSTLHILYRLSDFGLLITLGIGSSFSTIPILAIIYVPLCIQFGFSPAATIAIIGTAAALGDAGSPASDSTLGPTSGLNMDGQHDHMKDSVIPTFIHFNIPLMIFGWIAAMVL
jgi:predicted histidine transporter YuiF (NhaC family)